MFTPTRRLLLQTAAGLVGAAGFNLVYGVPTARALPEGKVIGRLQTHTAVYEDTLQELAMRYDVGYVELRAANPDVNAWLPGEGTPIMIPSQHLVPASDREGILINLGEMRMYYYPKKDAEPETYPVGIGREGLTTPLGKTTIVRKTAAPNWYPTERMRNDDPTLPKVVKPGDDNPLGSHAMYLGWPSYLIHGTNKPFGIGRRASSGCIRMYPDHITKMFGQTPVGTKVQVIDEPIKLAWVGGELYIEAHPHNEQADRVELGEPMPFDLPAGFTQRVTAIAAEQAERVDWQVVRQATGERRGVPIRITA